MAFENRETDNIRDRLDIVDVVGWFIPLKRQGRDFKACCPFHNEKTPSFVVSQEKQIFHCFGCGVGGDIFTFVMKYENISFVEALEYLAEKAGVTLQKRGGSGSSGSDKQLLLKVNELAGEYYSRVLFKSPGGSEGRDYIKKRGLSKDIVKSFRVGYALPEWDGFIKIARKHKISDDVLVQAGLAVKKNETGRVFDRFRGRVLFPIFDIQSRIIGFSGRVLDNSLPKYVNTPETPLFIKSNVLYGLNFAKKEILANKKVIVCEGQIDVISLHQRGIKNVVASQGTAFTPQQAKILKRYTEEVVLAFDADEAGLKAQLKGIEILLAEGLSVKVIEMPKGEDPDSIVGKQGADAFLKLVDEALVFFDFKLKILLSQYDINEDTGKTKIVNEMLAALKFIGGSVLRDKYIDKLAEISGAPKDILWQEFRGINLKSNFKKKKKSAITDTVKIVSDIPVAEQMLLKALLEEKDNRVFEHILKYLKPDEFLNPYANKVFTLMKDLFEKGEVISEINFSGLDENLKQFLSKISYSDIDKNFKEHIKNIKRKKIEKELSLLKKEMLDKSENHDIMTDLMKKYMGKQEELKAINVLF